MRESRSALLPLIKADRDDRSYLLRVQSSRDVDVRYGWTSISFDADTGSLKDLHIPAGRSSADTVTSWLVALHMAHVFGLPYRIFVCALGLIVTMLSVTGVIIWLKKKRARSLSHSQKTKAAGTNQIA